MWHAMITDAGTLMRFIYLSQLLVQQRNGRDFSSRSTKDESQRSILL